MFVILLIFIFCIISLPTDFVTRKNRLNDAALRCCLFPKLTFLKENGIINLYIYLHLRKDVFP